MKEKLTILAAVFSVMLNIAFAGSYLLHRWASSPASPKSVNTQPHIYTELNLSPQQIRSFEVIRKSFDAEALRIGSEIRSGQLQLIRLLAAPAADRQAVENEAKQIQAAQGLMRERVVDHLLATSAILTPEQRARFFALITERLQQTERPHPPWMPSPKTDRGGAKQ